MRKIVKNAMQAKVWILLSLNICSSLHSQEIDTLSTLSYFPLDVGNKWQYQVTSWQIIPPETTITYLDVEVTKDTVMANEKLYYEMTSTSDFIYFREVEYFRIDTASLAVYYYDPSFDSKNSDCQQEINLFELNFPDSTNEFFYETCDGLPVQSYDDSGNRQCLLDSGDCRTYSIFPGITVEFELCPGLGIARQFTGEGLEFLSACLDAAVIDGKQYGDFVVRIEENQAIPTTFELKQNFPNPFNASTSITYSISKISIVILTFYNILGEEIQKIQKGLQQAGSYTIDFNSDKFPSGIYFYSLQSGDEVSRIRKMLLLK